MRLYTDQLIGAPNEKIQLNTSTIIFCFLRLFQGFSRAYLRELIQIVLFGGFS